MVHHDYISQKLKKLQVAKSLPSFYNSTSPVKFSEYLVLKVKFLLLKPPNLCKTAVLLVLPRAVALQ